MSIMRSLLGCVAAVTPSGDVLKASFSALSWPNSRSIEQDDTTG
jgi:hypothetical protein